ncbi:hypothetical protein BDR04DRAFT_1018673, partial [Suillus decipiens]
LNKALQCCSDAICNAINCYNTQTTALNPPCSKISWKDITDYGFVAKFNLLQYSHNDIQSSAWSKPGH